MKMKKGIMVLAVCITATALTGCCVKHQWEEASCNTPKTCSECGKTEGEASGHQWQEATCELPKTCSQCGETEGNSLGHDWKEATCEEPRTCSRCKSIEGEALGHNFTEANYQTPKTCTNCMATEGEKLVGFFEQNGLQCHEDLGTVYDFVTTTADKTSPVNGEVSITDYRKFESDDTHEAKEGYIWREWTITFKTSDQNAANYGYGFGAGFADYYLGVVDVSEDENGKFTWGGKTTGNVWENTVMVNINGEVYETYVRSASLGGKWNGNTATMSFVMSWLTPVEYDSAVVYAYSHKYADPDTFEEFIEDIHNSFLFIKLE